MHISEGILTGTTAAAYTGIGLGLVGLGAYKMKRFVDKHPENRPLLGMAGAIIFFISLIPIPAFTGTCTHPCGTPLVAILLGPMIGVALSGVSLLLQAAFFAHGGFSTWGANVVALGFAGSFTGWGVYRLLRRFGAPLWASGFAAGLLGDLAVYGVSGLILGTTLASAPNAQYSLPGYLTAIFAAYLPTQIPIALGEMFLTGLALHYAFKRRPEVLAELGLVRGADVTGNHTPSTASKVLVALALILIPASAAALPESPGAPTVVVQASERVAVQAPAQEGSSGFSGMDEAVNEHLAEEAGRAPRDPYINLEAMGDLWNSMLLLAGGICGFILGRSWHLLFGKSPKTACRQAPDAGRPFAA